MAFRCLSASRRLRGSSFLPHRSCVLQRCFSSGSDDGDKVQVDLAALQEPVARKHLDTSGLWPIMEVPVTVVSGFLDTMHSSTGAPWWAVLVGSTLAMRALLFPITVKEVQKTTQFLQNAWQLPRPIPMPGSGKTIMEQFKLFSQKRKELGLPSPAWFLTPFVVQMPLFITWIVTIRHMAMSKYPGFDTGGALWFTDLTVPVHGLGIIFPITVASAFIFNLEMALKGVGKKPGFFGNWIMVYRWWLRAFTIPILFSGFYLPQGVYMYWLPNSLFSLSQTLVLKSRWTRKLFGLPVTPLSPEVVAGKASSDSNTLIKLAAEHLENNNCDAAVQSLQLALEKDPDNASAHYSLGNMYSAVKQWSAAVEALELAVSKAKEEELKISAILALGIALYNQGKTAESFDALKSVSNMDVPLDGLCRKKYYMTLVTLGSMLNKHGHKIEALEYFEKVAEYDPKIGDMFVKPIRKELEEEQNSQHKVKHEDAQEVVK